MPMINDPFAHTFANGSPRLRVLTSPDWRDYELLDSGGGLRLERFGAYTLIRPEPEAVWSPRLPEKNWQAAHARFQPSTEENGGHWETLKPVPPRWLIDYKGLKCWVQLSASRHVGIFPEQASQWDWVASQCQQHAQRTGTPAKVLNLFGYTGMVTLAAGRAGAQVTHVDASRKVITWANENQAESGLQQSAIRWIVDDALKFIQREGRRGVQYNGLIVDPPKFGRGPKGEVWEFYKLLPTLLDACRQVLARPSPSFISLTAYAVKASALTLAAAVQAMLPPNAPPPVAGEIALVDTSGGRLLSTAIFASWAKEGG